MDDASIFAELAPSSLHPVPARWYTSPVPGQRRLRRLRPDVPVVLAGLVLAVIGSLALATTASPSSSGALGSVEGAIDQPLDAGLPGVSSVPAPSHADEPAPAPISVIAGPGAGMGFVAQRERSALSPIPTAAVALSGYRWPLPRGRITLPFGPWHGGSRIVDGLPFHDGLDLATSCGDRIVAAHAGVVLAAGHHYDSQMGWIGDLGPYFDRLDAKSLWVTLPIVVVIDDGNGYRSIYAHFGRIVVKRGQTVQAGQSLGYEGRTGNASGCHLHYGLFSPEASGRFGIDPAVVEHMKLPAWEVARVDPLLVLPQRTWSSLKPAATLK